MSSCSTSITFIFSSSNKTLYTSGETNSGCKSKDTVDESSDIEVNAIILNTPKRIIGGTGISSR